MSEGENGPDEASSEPEIEVLFPTKSTRRRRRQKKSRKAAPASQSSDATANTSRPEDQDLDRNPQYVELHKSVRKNNLEQTKAIVKDISNINVVSLPEYQTPLHFAASLGFDGIIDILSGHRTFEVDIRVRETGFTPLLLAVSNGHVASVEALLAHKASVERKANNGTSPLTMACLVDETECAIALLQSKADPNSTRDSGSGPIHFAALHNNADVLVALLEAKAQPSLENGQNLTALKIAAVQGSMQFAKVLVQHQSSSAATWTDLEEEQLEGSSPPALRSRRKRFFAEDSSPSSGWVVEGPEGDANEEGDGEIENEYGGEESESQRQIAEALALARARLQQDNLCNGSKASRLSAALTALASVLAILVAVLLKEWFRQGYLVTNLQAELSRCRVNCRPR